MSHSLSCLTFFTLSLFYTLAGSLIVKAQSVSKPIAVFSVHVHGSSTEHPLRTTHLGTHLTPEPIFSGPVHQVSGKILNLSDQLFNNETVEDFVPQNLVPAEKYYLHFMSDSAEGYIANITSITGNEIHCEDDLPSFVQPGQYFTITRHRRLSEVFTADNSLGFGAGESAALSDNVAIFNPDTQVEELFYFNSIRSRWEKEGVAEDATHQTLRYPYAYSVIRRTPGLIKMFIRGQVSEIPILLPIKTGLNLFSIPAWNATTISNLVTTSGPFPAQSGPNAATSDLFMIHESSTVTPRGPFYYSSASNDPKWLKVGDSNSTEPTTPVDPLSTLRIHRKGAPGFLKLNAHEYYGASPFFTLDADPQPGETESYYTLTYRPDPFFFSPWNSYSLQSNSGTQFWLELSDDIHVPGDTMIYSVRYPTGQNRIFYRFILLE